ncbi:hypothetical protein GCM10009535_40300 [Streptomyces thermocarboxydovorans]|uniref:DUF3987 domain-containing protein n=1 Tax=Streptomyces thermocarboxydovorans TaxID=59298 RepID=A0ABN1HKV8_9ACTN
MSSKKNAPEATGAQSDQRAGGSVTTVADPDVVRAWMKNQYGEAPGLISVITSNDRTGRRFDCVDQAAEYAAAVDVPGVKGVYAQVTTLARPPERGGRGGAELAHALIDMWSDIDFGTVGHAEGKVPNPPDAEQALRIWTESGLPEPSSVINSGGGLYVRARFDRPLIIGEDITREDAKRLAADWQNILGESAGRLGYAYGTGVKDLARVLRIPGTVNRKEDLARPCVLVSDDGPRYGYTELRHLADRLAPKTRAPRSRDNRDTTRGAVRSVNTQQGSVTVVTPSGGPLGILGDHPVVPALLEHVGWTYREQSPGGCGYCGSADQYWSYPGYVDGVNGTGAAVHRGENTITIWSETPGLPTGEVMSAGGLFAHLHHGGNMSAAALDLMRAAHGRGAATPAARAVPAEVLAAIKTATETPEVRDNRDTTPDAVQYPDPSEVVSRLSREMAAEKPLPVDRPRVPRFPLAALGESSLARMVEALAASAQVSPDLAVILALPVITTAIGGRAAVQIRPGWREQLVLWTVGVALPGERKTQIERLLTNPLREEEARLRGAAAPLIQEAETRRRVYEERVRSAEKNAVRAKPADLEKAMQEVNLAQKVLNDVGEVPALPSLFFGDITPAAMPIKAGENDGRGAVIDSEGVFFKNATGRRFGTGTPDTTFALQAYDGVAVPVHRVQRGSVDLEHAWLSLGLLVQPVMLTTLAKDDDDELLHNGFVQRPLYSYPESALGGRDPRNARPVPADITDDYSTRIKTLVKQLWQAKEQRIITFAPEANEFMYRFEETLEPRMAPNGDLRPLMSWASKLPGKLARIAAALTLYDNPTATEVTGDYMAAAVSMAPYFITHAQLCLDLMGANRDSRLVPARDVLDWLRTRDKPGEPFTLRDVHRGVRRKWVEDGGRDAVSAALAVLEERGWIAALPAEQPPARGGRPPSPKYLPHPQITNQPEETQ